MKLISQLLILIILVACGKTEEGFLKNDLTDSERQYLLTQRKDKCLNEEQVKKDFETLSTKSTNSFSELSKTLSEYTSSTTPKTLVYKRTVVTQLNAKASSDTDKLDIYIIGFNSAKDEFYYVEAQEDGDVKSHGKYSVTENGDDIVDLRKEYCTYRSATHSLNGNFVMSLSTVIETMPTDRVKNVVTKTYSVNSLLPMFLTVDPANETEIITDDRGDTRKVTSSVIKTTYAKASGKYSTQEKAAEPFCEYYEDEFSTDLGDCSSLSYSTVVNALIAKIKAE
jgi:hypothetical protein